MSDLQRLHTMRPTPPTIKMSDCEIAARQNAKRRGTTEAEELVRVLASIEDFGAVLILDR